MAVLDLGARPCLLEIVLQPGAPVWIRRRRRLDGESVVQSAELKSIGLRHAIVEVRNRRGDLRCLAVHLTQVFPRHEGDGSI